MKLDLSIVEKIIKLSDGKMTQTDIAKHCDISRDSVQRYQKKLNLIKRDRTGAKRYDNHFSFRYGRSIDTDGYILIPCGPEHPNVRKLPERRGGRILEHRIMAEIKLGRLLDKKEVVDHIDKCTLNNHPDNLRVFSTNSDHLKATLTLQVPKWSCEGKQKISLARWHPDKAIDKFGLKVDSRTPLLKQGEIRLQQIRRCYELFENQGLWLYGMNKYFLQMNIDWPFDQKREESLRLKYRQMIFRHPLLKLSYEG
jgi:hypothetical protein